MKMIVKLTVLLILTSCSIPEVPIPDDEFDFECPACPKCPTAPACPAIPECPAIPACPTCPGLPDPVDPEPSDPETITDTFRNGTLWKPVADHDPNVVVLIEGKYDEQFENCYYYIQGAPREMSCRKWENNQWVPRCFTNEHQGKLRQTWRAAHKCSVIDKVKVTCKLKGDTYIFEKQGADTCSRHE